MDRLFSTVTWIFDPLHAFWEGEKTRKAMAFILVIVFLGSILAVELNRLGIMPKSFDWFTPTRHIYAVNIAFGLVLIIEVISLVFTLPCSISKSVGKQFEILALILLRSAFKELSAFPEPITVAGNIEPLLKLSADGVGALAIFALLGVYRMLHRSEDDEIKRGKSLFRFVAAKKIVALGLLITLICLGAYDLWIMASGKKGLDFFPIFYTILIFSDILLVLISHRYLPRFRAIFRNSGFALTTLFIRLALTAPVFLNAALGVGAVLYAVFLTLVYNKFYLPKE